MGERRKHWFQRGRNVFRSLIPIIFTVNCLKKKTQTDKGIN